MKPRILMVLSITLALSPALSACAHKHAGHPAAAHPANADAPTSALALHSNTLEWIPASSETAPAGQTMPMQSHPHAAGGQTGAEPATPAPSVSSGGSDRGHQH